MDAEKNIWLGKYQPREWKTQSRYTPDAGEVETVYCGVCDSVMEVQRNVNGPRGWVQAMGRGNSSHDVFNCSLRENDWHKQVVAIRKESRNTSSQKLKNMLLDEADEILKDRKATIQVDELNS